MTDSWLGPEMQTFGCLYVQAEMISFFPQVSLGRVYVCSALCCAV
jgi:hypothetical protein